MLDTFASLGIGFAGRSGIINTMSCVRLGGLDVIMPHELIRLFDLATPVAVTSSTFAAFHKTASEEMLMPLNLNVRRSSEGFLTGLRYSGRDAVWLTRDERGLDVALPEITMIIDFVNILTAWMYFATGMPPDIRWDVNGKAEPRPGKEFRRGFGVNVLLETDDLGARNLISNNVGLCEAIVRLYDEYEHAPEAKRGLLSRVQSGAPVPVETSFGVVWDPTLEKIDWVPRPATLPPFKPQTKPPARHENNHTDLDDDIPF
jgi:hypothetical protein